MLKIENLSFKYEGGSFALDNINLVAKKSKIHAIIGANGAGKSTLFMSILGLIKPSEGSVCLDGNKLIYKKKSLRDYRKKVNLVMQNPDQQIFYSRVIDDIAFPLKNIGMNEDAIDAKVEKALCDMDIYELKDRAPHTLSYGQKKRVAIAGVIAMDCDYILFDEPTAGLDPKLTREMIAILKELKDKAKGIIISSHDMDFIYSIADYISVISNGKIISSGTKEEVFQDENLIYNAGLELPSLVRIAKKLGCPLFSDEEELIKYIKG